MTMPNFFIIGAVRSGTTSIYNYLAQHPEIYVSPVKEPKYFQYDGLPSPRGNEKRDAADGRAAQHDHGAVTDMKAYQALFSGVMGEKAVGEASVGYLTAPGAPERIHAVVPDAKIIAMLRNPIDRAFSSFLFHIRINRETNHDFTQAVQADGWRRRHYIEDGMYFKALQQYLSVFNRDHVFVCLYNDFVEDPLGLIRGIFDFLGVDREFTPDMSIRYNVSGIPKSRWLHRMIWVLSKPVKCLAGPFIPAGLEKSVRRVSGSNLHRPKIDPEARRYLLDAYEKDIANLQELIGRDLSQWLENET